MTLESITRETIPSEWTTVGNNTAAQATADRAGSSGFVQIVTFITCSYDRAPTTTGAAGIFDIVEDPAGSATVKFQVYYPPSGQANPDPLVIFFTGHPIRIGDGLTVRVRLDSGGAGVIGRVSMGGYQLPASLRF